MEFFAIGVYYYIFFKLKKRRNSDKGLFALCLLFGGSYFLYGLEFISLETKLFQVIIDAGIAIVLALYFIQQMRHLLKNNIKNDRKNEND